MENERKIYTDSHFAFEAEGLRDNRIMFSTNHFSQDPPGQNNYISPKSQLE
jgi:hypothetical protein